MYATRQRQLFRGTTLRLALTAVCLPAIACGQPDPIPAAGELAWPDPGVELTALNAEQVPKPLHRLEFEGLQPALKALDFDFVDRHKIEGPPQELSRMLASVFSLDREGALKAATALAGRDDLDSVAQLAAEVRIQLLKDGGHYAEMVKTFGGADKAPSLFVGLAAAPPQKLSFNSKPFTTVMTRAPTGAAMVEVGIGKQRLSLAVDTGAVMTVLTESAAQRVDATLNSTPSFDLSTSTNITVDTRAGYLSELRFGHAVLAHHPVLIVPDSALRFPMPDGGELVLQGILGWNVIRQGRLVLDWSRGEFEFTSSSAHSDQPTNLFWLGYPLVTLTAHDGQRLLFGLDTGSRNTAIHPPIFDKLTFNEIRRESVSIGGAGGSEETETEVVDLLDITIGTTRVRIPNVQRENHDDAVFVTMDGLLGVDLAQHARLVVDFPKGVFQVVP